MKIAFLTTQTISGSTVVGRVLPLAREIAKKHEIHVLVHQGEAAQKTPGMTMHEFGKDPFIRTSAGKRRLRGIALIGRLKFNAYLAAVSLFRIKPDVVVIVKSLPESVLAAWIAKLIFLPHAKYILDVDDFELTANKLSSPLQRAAVHWAQRAGVHAASKVIAATPFLQNYFMQLAPGKVVSLIPTGITGTVEAQSPSRVPTVLYAGSVSLVSGHRVDILPEIFTYVRSALPKVRLIIAGSGDDIANLKSAFTKRKLAHAVTWFGRFTSKDLPELFTADIILDPVDDSITNRAKSSFRVLAALAAGRPLVTSNIGIRSLLIPPAFHAPFFARPGDAADYAKKTIELLRKPLPVSLSDQLKQHAMRYTWDMLATQYLALLS